MSRFLSLDWDHGQIHLLSAKVSKGGVEVQRAVLWSEERIPNLAEAEELGRLLRERLKQADIAPAPVLVCVGRDRLVLREVRFPAVPAHEEPAIVRFQVTKELHDSPDDVVIDYVPLGNGGAGGNEGNVGGERRALTLLLRKELLEAYRTLCRTAGLKLAVVAPRVFGSATCLRHMIGRSLQTPPPEPPEAPVALLVMCEHWAEFCVLKGESVVFARPVGVGESLAAEVQRNMRVLGGQIGHEPIRAIYVAGGDEHADLRHTLQEKLEIPVYPFDPLQGVHRQDLADNQRGSFAGTAGLLHEQSQRRGHPINFVEPRQPAAPVNPNRRLILVGSVLGAAAMLVIGFFIFGAVMNMQRRNQALRQQLADLEREEADLQPVAKNYDAVQDWLKSHLICLDELYDTTVIDPDHKDIKITSWSCTPPAVTTVNPRDKNKKDSDKDYVARITIVGKVTQKHLADKLRDLFKEDPNYNVVKYDILPAGLDSQERDFSLIIETKKRDLTAFQRKLDIPKPAKPKQELNRGGRGGRGSGEGQP